MRVEWQRSATADFRRILHYLADRNPMAARRVARALLLAGDSLALFPSRGSPGSPAGTRELMTVPPYIIVYRISGDVVSIVRIWHSAQDRP